MHDTLVLPDWGQLDDVRRDPLPFALWPVGDQPLLHHWLDEAVDQGIRRVRILCSDRPAEVRRAMEDASLWPIDWSLDAVASLPASAPDVEYVDRLPGRALAVPAPNDGWELLDRWFALRRQWFEDAPRAVPHFDRLALGRFTQIHPNAEVIPPVWFEDFAQIGPGSRVGPYVNLGRGAVIEGPSVVENAVITGGTLLAGHTELRDAVLDGGRLLHLRHRANIPKLDVLIADGLGRARAPSVAERAAAAVMYAGFEGAARLGARLGKTRRFETFDGLQLEEDLEGPLWRRRRRWLKEVVKGNLRLWGVLPRTARDLASIDPEWRRVLGDAPSGVFAYSDLHGSHEADAELEPIHAVFQASSSADAMREVFKENAWRLLTTRPEDRKAD